MLLKLLVSPLAKGAYFSDYLKVAAVEFRTLFPDTDFTLEKIASLDFLCVELLQADFQKLSRLSFVQGLFKATENGIKPLNEDAKFVLPEELVFGVKYAGKTNELVTQLGLNVGLQSARLGEGETPKLLDPMAGKGTSLLWAVRYGCDAIGIEQDPAALAAFQRHIKKQTKLLRIKHRQQEGFIGKPNSQNMGKFLHFELQGTAQSQQQETNPQQENHGSKHYSLKLVVGDSSEAKRLIQKKSVNLLLADLPYGVQHFTTPGTRNPLDTLQACADEWISCLRKGAAMVLIFNSYQPKRDALIKLFAGKGMQLQDFTAPHRMSESILRDLVVFVKQ